MEEFLVDVLLVVDYLAIVELKVQDFLKSTVGKLC